MGGRSDCVRFFREARTVCSVMACWTELGCDVHPIFVNESGRHWFTALNAYRHFRGQYRRGTARVWVNADRLFAWMLRRMPFIRQGLFQPDIRADEYPIGLWTVAVLSLRAFCPLMQKRGGLGRLVIGDEFDTSRRITTSGIRHYDGLYDQSRWFDDAAKPLFHAQRLVHRPILPILRPPFRAAHRENPGQALSPSSGAHQTVMPCHPQGRMNAYGRADGVKSAAALSAC